MFDPSNKIYKICDIIELYAYQSSKLSLYELQDRGVNFIR